MSGVGAGRAVRGGGGADSALAGGDSEALPVDGASRYGLSSPTESGLCGDRVRPRRLGRLRSVIRKLRVIRWLSSGRTERRCMASEAMSQERRIGKPTRKARARAKRRRNKDGKGEVPSHSSKDEIRLSVPLEECAKQFARPITRGARTQDRHPVPHWHSTRGLRASLRDRYPWSITTQTVLRNPPPREDANPLRYADHDRPTL